MSPASWRCLLITAPIDWLFMFHLKNHIVIAGLCGVLLQLYEWAIQAKSHGSLVFGLIALYDILVGIFNNGSFNL